MFCLHCLCFVASLRDKIRRIKLTHAVRSLSRRERNRISEARTLTHTDTDLEQQTSTAVAAMREGGVIAYPTEYCFGLGCDPRNPKAVEHLLRIKQRKAEQGVILIAADKTQVCAWVDLASSPLRAEIEASWPGPNTWLLPAQEHVTSWVKGHHTTVAMRIPALSMCRDLCREFGDAIVSTSANRHGQEALLSAQAVTDEMGDELAYVINAPVGGASAASTIRHGLTGELIR